MALSQNGVGIMGKYENSVGGKLQVDGRRIDKPIIHNKDANGWIKIEFIDHVEYVYYNVINRTFPKDWGYADSVPLPVGIESLGERVLTNSVMSTDAAVVISAGAYQNSKNIFVEYNNAYSGTTGSTDYILSFRILEYK